MKLKLIISVFGVALIASYSHAQTEPAARPFRQSLTSAEQAQAVPKGEKVAMACAKCKTVQVADVDKNKTFLGWFESNTKHLCPGCGGHWGYVVYGKSSRHGDYVHTCSKCGDKSVYCCATKAGKKTPGM
jgi:hypothetical protein